jgi:hypothetical protein
MTEHEKHRATINAHNAAADRAKYKMCGGCGATDPKDRCLGCLHDFGGGSVNIDPYEVTAIPPTVLSFPRELTADLRDVLSTMIWTSGQIAHCLRAGGEVIKKRAEDEQAHVLHWLICLALEHGSAWREKASDRIREIQDSTAKQGGNNG